MKPAMNIKIRLTLWFLIIITIILAFWGVIAYSLLARSLLQKNVNPISIRTTQLKNVAGVGQPISQTDIIDPKSETGNNLPVVSIGFTIKQLKEASLKNKYFYVQTPDGPLALDTSSIIIDNFPENMYVWLYLYPNLNEPNVYNLVAVYQPGIQGILGIFVNTLWITIPLTLILAGFLGYLLVKRMLKPVQTITRTAQEIEGSNLSSRITVNNDDEIGKLSATLNRMFQRLEDAFVREKQFTADASHELRTPLSIIQGEAELALQKPRNDEEYQMALESILKETKHMSSVTQRLLFLARDSGNQQLLLEDVDLKLLLEDIVQDAEVLCQGKEILIQFTALSSQKIRGDKILLRELFLNLVDNAVRYTPPKGKISILYEERGESACISVKDTGIGIPKEHLSHLFERFYRAERTRSRGTGGAGLGLAICKKIVELHAGKIDVESEEGKGSIFTVCLPSTRQ